MTTNFTGARRARLAMLFTAGLAAASTAAANGLRPDAVVPNDNRRPAGELANGTLTLALRATHGRWQPHGPDGPAVAIDAFGEAGGPPSVPAPLLRVAEGTTVVVSIANELPAPLRVHGLCTRDGSPCAALDVPPSATREVRFASGRAGTYHYWATTIGAPVPFRELAGAYIVDPPAADPDADRVLVITEWSSLTPAELGQIFAADDPGEAFVARQPGAAFMVNGLGWPATERLSYRLGERVRWRVLNLSSQPHPMHLHGFYFDVERLGDGRRDMPVDPTRPRLVVTQLVPPAGTLTMAWTPERAGNWLFHCHLMEHVSPMRRIFDPDRHGEPGPAAPDSHAHHDAALGMSGLVLGVTITGSNSAPDPSAVPPAPVRKLTLAMHEDSADPEGRPVAGFALREGGGPPAPPSSPGPTVVLRRGEPVEITLENELREATAVHWHGMELESYYDGVHGYSGIGPRQTPIIEAGGRFVVRFTPPHAGTFIYHTHLHDHRQLSSGLYGAMVVLEPGESFDPETDHVLVLGRSGLTSGVLAIPDGSTPAVLNGERSPRLVWSAGRRHRLRLINITPDDIFAVSLQAAGLPAEWTPLAKDGATLPDEARLPVPARVTIAVGETYDFELAVPPGRRNYWLEVRTAPGRWQLQAHVIVR